MKALTISLFILASVCAAGAQATAPSCTFANHPFGGKRATCSNPNAGTTIACATLDGATPATNGSGTACTTGFALSGSTSYFPVIASSTVKVIAGASGKTDSTVFSSVQTVAQWTITADSFGFQCGSGVSTNCLVVGGVITWPTVTPPKMVRLWDTQSQWWNLMTGYNSGTDVGTYTWTNLDQWLDAIATHGADATYTLGRTPSFLTTTGCGTQGCAGAPSDLTATGSPAFNRFVRDLTTHCTTHAAPNYCFNDYVKFVELWNEANATGFWAADKVALGTSQDQLYDLLAPAVPIIRANITGVSIGTPPLSAGAGFQAWEQGWQAKETTKGILSDYYVTHNYLIDVTPENRMLGGTPGNQSCVNTGVGCTKTANWPTMPMNQSETAFNTTIFACSDGVNGRPATYSINDCTGQIWRWLILLMSNGLRGQDYYFWNTVFNPATPVSSQYITAYQNFQTQTIGGFFPSAAVSDGAVPPTWTAPFTDANSKAKLFVWSTGSKSYTVPAGYNSYSAYDGTLSSTAVGQSLTIGVTPVLLSPDLLLIPSCSPSGGTFKSGRMIVCTNADPAATMCWRLGTPPTTNGAGTCTAGTTYTAPFMVTSTSTLYVTGTKSGSVDNTVALSYTINPTWTTGWVMNTLTTGTAHFGPINTGACTPPNYCANTSVSIAPWPTVPTMTGVDPLRRNVGTVIDTSLPASTPSPVVRCTDFYGEPGLPTASANALSKSAGLGASGEALGLFSANDTMLHYNNSGGGDRITLFNPTTMVCGDPVTGFAITGDKKIPPGSATSYNVGGGAFSWNDSECSAGQSAWYGLGSADTTSTTQIALYCISQTDGKFTVTPNYVDFSYGLPLGTRAPAWQAGTPYTAGQYVSVTLAGLPDWNGSTARIPGDLIQPADLTKNPAQCVFKVASVGTRGAQPTQWSTGSTCNTTQLNGEGLGSTHACTGGVECYRNIGNDGTFAFQALTSGTSGSGPTWAPTPAGASTVHPDLMTQVTDGGSLIWENSGPTVAPLWNSFAGVSKDSNRFAISLSSNSYGHGTGTYNVDNADQGTGNYEVAYDISANKFVLLNTVTGFQTTITCAGDSSYTCALGTTTLTTPSTPITAISNCAFPIHNSKGGSTMDYVVMAQQGTYGAAGCPASIGNGPPNMLDWQPFAVYSATTSGQRYNTKGNHWAIGKKLMVNVGDRTLPGWGTAGAYTTLLQSDNPTAVPVTSWQVGAPYTNPCSTSWTANSPNPPCDFGVLYDSHLAFWHTASDDDTGPVCGTMFDVATGHPQPVAAYDGEEVCVTTSPNWSLGSPIGAYKVWRFTHTFITLTNPFFDVQFGISQLSTTGKFLAFSSDWNGTLGTTSGTAGPALFGYNWQPSTTYTAGTFINPFQNLNGAGTNFGVWKVTVGGNTTTTKPAWVTCNATTNVGLTISQDGVSYQCQGANNSKGEVFIVKLN